MTLSYLISTLLYILPCFLLLFLTFRDRFRVPLIPRISVSLFIFSVIGLSGAYIFMALDSTLLRTLLSLPIMVSAVCLFCNAITYDFWQGVFIIAFVNCYVENVYVLSLYMHFAITKVFPIPSSLRAIYTTFPLTVLSLPFAYMFLKKLLRPALDYTVSLKIWRTMWIIPICNTVIHSLTISPHLASSYFIPGNAFFVVPPVWILLNFTTYTIILQMIISMSKNAVLQETLHLSENQISAQQKQLEALQHHIEQTRRYRHDMRHHILAIKGFLDNHDQVNLESYLHRLTDGLPALPSNYCENQVINALLCYYSEIAENENIKINFSIAITETPFFSDTDLCIILGNFLENALEACHRMKSPDKFITLKISMPSRLILVILTENSYEGTIRRTKDGTFLSSKAENRKGIGISSITHVIEKYSGISRFEYQEPVFKASLLLNAKEQPE
jgi:two-component system sensor histidine kinase AgrC